MVPETEVELGWSLTIPPLFYPAVPPLCAGHRAELGFCVSRGSVALKHRGLTEQPTEHLPTVTLCFLAPLPLW
jgi:hypothetical protein